MKTLCIVNLNASRAAQNVDVIKQTLASHDVEESKISIVEDASVLDGVMQEAIGKNPDILIVGGGDGTILSAMGAIIGQKKDITMGILPVGTSNYLARNLNIPLDPQEAVERIFTCRQPKSIYLAKAGDKWFSLLCTIGVTERAEKNLPISLKKRIGQMAYLVATLRQLIRHNAFDYELVDENGDKHTGKTHQIVIANANLNMQLRVVPEADIHSKGLQVTVYETYKSRIRLLLSLVLFIISLGKFRRHMFTKKAASLALTTVPVRSVSLDGEDGGSTPVTIEATDCSVEVLC